MPIKKASGNLTVFVTLNEQEAELWRMVSSQLQDQIPAGVKATKKGILLALLNREIQRKQRLQNDRKRSR